MGQILMHGTWAERDLDNYLKRYAEGSDETERRTCTCDFCGKNFDYLDGKVIEVGRLSNIKIRGNRPEELYICRTCLKYSTYNIELEELK